MLKIDLQYADML